MNVTTYAVAPYTYFRQHDELVGALDRLFREHRVPPAIVQYSFADRRATGYYDELVYILTPFPTRPTSELLEDIGRAVAPAQARLTTLLSCHYPPVFPPLPVTPLYAPPNEENFTVARSYLQPADDYRGRATPGGFQSTFESTMAIETSESNLIKSTLRASYVVKVKVSAPFSVVSTALTILLSHAPKGQPLQRLPLLVLELPSSIKLTQIITHTFFIPFRLASAKIHTLRRDALSPHTLRHAIRGLNEHVMVFATNPLGSGRSWMSSCA
jgi:hypothetical protein